MSFGTPGGTRIDVGKLQRKLQQAYQEKNMLLNEILMLKQKLRTNSEVALSRDGKEISNEGDREVWNRLLESNLRSGTIACLWCLKAQVIKMMGKAFRIWQRSAFFAGSSVGGRRGVASSSSASSSSSSSDPAIAVAMSLLAKLSKSTSPENGAAIGQFVHDLLDQEENQNQRKSPNRHQQHMPQHDGRRHALCKSIIHCTMRNERNG